MGFREGLTNAVQQAGLFQDGIGDDQDPPSARDGRQRRRVGDMPLRPKSNWPAE